MFETFYHQSIRKLIAGFGTLFNDITIQRTEDRGEDGIPDYTAPSQLIKVPIAYASKEKWLARINQIGSISENTNKVQTILPRMSFFLTSMNYDESRKLNSLQRHVTEDSQDNEILHAQYQRVAYNFEIELYIYAKNMDDSLQIIEQICPYFSPEYTISIKDIPELSILTDVPIILNTITKEEQYEDDFTTRRSIVWTLNFTLKGHLYGPTSSTGIIRKIIVDFYTDPEFAARQVRITTDPDPITAGPEDDYGFTNTIEDFNDGKKRDPVTGIDT